MRLIIIVIAAAWGIGAVWAFALTANRSLDAKLTAAYILCWPALVAILYLNDPVPLWISVPVMFGFIPWFMAGPHLSEILADPARTKPDEIIGIPKDYWFWGGIGAILLGLVFNRYA